MIYTAELPAELRRTLSPSGRYSFEFQDSPPAGHVVYVVWDESLRFYVGSAGDFASRMRQHQRQLDRGTHNYLMQEAFDLNPGAFRVTVISAHANRLEAYAAEQRILDNTTGQYRAGRMNVNPLACGLGDGAENPGATPVTIVSDEGERIVADTTAQAATVLDVSQPYLMNMMDGRVPILPGVARIFRTFGKTSAPNTGRPGKPVVVVNAEGQTTIYASLTRAADELRCGYDRLGRAIRSGRTIEPLASVRYL